MVAVRIDSFGGMVPAVDDRLLPENGAAEATNTWLYSGTLQGMRTERLLKTLNSTTKKIYRIPKAQTDKEHLQDSYWLEFAEQDVDVVRSPTVNDSFKRVYWAGGGGTPKYNTEARIIAGNPEFTLGVPAPSVAPTVTLSANTNATLTAGIGRYGVVGRAVSLIKTHTTGKTEVDNTGSSPTGSVPGMVDPKPAIVATRAYVYTWATAYGEEGPPSPPTLVSGDVTSEWQIGTTAPAAGDTTGRNLTKVRIYRTITSSQGVATYFLVAELTMPTYTYSDTLTDATVSGNNQLESTGWTAPPSDLKGMVAMPNGIVAGFRDNEIWFCEPYRPHAWPVAYTLAVDSTVIGLGVVGQSIIVATTTFPYSCTGIHPSTMSLARIAAYEPCLSRGSIVGTPQGVFYASQNGLILAQPGIVMNVTKDLMTKDKWLSLMHPANLCAVALGSSYFAYGRINFGCFDVLSFQPTAFEQLDYSGSYDGGLIELNNQRVAFNIMYSSVPTTNIQTDSWSGEVLVIRDNKLYHLDLSDSATRGAYTWKSKIYQAPNKRNFEAMKIYYTNPTGVTPTGTVKVYADNTLVSTQPITASGRMMRLPSGFKADFWQVEIEGNLLVHNLQMATSAKELVSV